MGFVSFFVIFLTRDAPRPGLGPRRWESARQSRGFGNSTTLDPPVCSVWRGFRRIRTKKRGQVGFFLNDRRPARAPRAAAREVKDTNERAPSRGRPGHANGRAMGQRKCINAHYYGPWPPKSLCARFRAHRCRSAPRGDRGVHKCTFERL